MRLLGNHSDCGRRSRPPPDSIRDVPVHDHVIDATLALWGLNALAVLTGLIQLALRIRPMPRVLLGLALAVLWGVGGIFLTGPLDDLIFPFVSSLDK